MGHAEIAETSVAISLGDRLVRAEFRMGAGREKVTRVALTLDVRPVQRMKSSRRSSLLPFHR